MGFSWLTELIYSKIRNDWIVMFRWGDFYIREFQNWEFYVPEVHENQGDP